MFDVGLDLLYWQAQVNGLGYVSERTAAHTEIHSPHFDWDPGLRLRLAYFLPHDEWDLSFIVTRLHTKGVGNAQGILYPTWASPIFLEDNGYVDNAQARWRLHFGEFDLALGKHISFSPNFSLHPYFGARVACIRQKFCVYYSGGVLFPDGEDRISTKNKFLGGGLLVGADAAWSFGRGFHLFTEGGFSLLYGDYYVHEGEKATCGTKKRLSFHYLFAGAAPTLDLSLGIEWTRGDWGVHLGWEEHFFFGQNQLVHFVGDKNPGAYVSNLGDLSLQGLNLGASLRF